MCGISGELRLDGARPDGAAVARMSACQADRGPDGQGDWQHGPLALAHRRLRAELSAAGYRFTVPVTPRSC